MPAPSRCFLEVCEPGCTSELRSGSNRTRNCFILKEWEKQTQTDSPPTAATTGCPPPSRCCRAALSRPRPTLLQPEEGLVQLLHLVEVQQPRLPTARHGCCRLPAAPPAAGGWPCRGEHTHEANPSAAARGAGGRSGAPHAAGAAYIFRSPGASGYGAKGEEEQGGREPSALPRPAAAAPRGSSRPRAAPGRGAPDTCHPAALSLCHPAALSLSPRRPPARPLPPGPVAAILTGRDRSGGCRG